MRRVLICLLTALSLGGCGSDTPVAVTPPQSPLVSIAPAESTSKAVGSATMKSTALATTPKVSGGWEITVYYTAVEQYHHGAAEQVTGCLTLTCSNGNDDLGSYPADFVQAVKDEGTGRTQSGRYLNWSFDTGYWLDSATRDSYGNALVPFVSAAADPDVLARGTHFTIARCGTADDGSAPPAAVCAKLRAAAWTVTDEFTPGLGGSKHIDAYIGPETGTGFTDSDWYVTLEGATLESSD